MAEIFPFAAYRYNSARVALEKVFTQPYDKITPEMQENYYSRSPYNLIPIEKGKALPGDTPENNVYTRAAQTLKTWAAEGILGRDPAPAIYAYFQGFQVPGTSQRKTRKGFIALGRIHDYEDGVVFRHEQTHSGPKADRLELLRRTRCHTGQLFMLYSDPARRVDAILDQVSRVPAPVEVRDDYGVVHRLWRVVDAATIERFRAAMADQKVVIADGHHRYETALAYRNERRGVLTKPAADAAHEKVMITFINSHSEGLTILPTHRLVSGLPEFRLDTLRERLAPHFDWNVYPFSSAAERAAAFQEFRDDLVGEPGASGRGRAIGVYAGAGAQRPLATDSGQAGAFYLLRLRGDAELGALLSEVSPAQRGLDVVLLHRVILERTLGISADAVCKEQHIAYEREMDAAIAAVDRGEGQACFFLNAVRVEQVMEMALGGEVLPQKSTDFYPKLLSGLTIYRLDE